jgi:hypothetical protein
MPTFQLKCCNIFRIFYEFLLGNERSVAQEVCVEYMETMGKVYYSYFKAYISRLMKLQVVYKIKINPLYHELSFKF